MGSPWGTRLSAVLFFALLFNFWSTKTFANEIDEKVQPEAWGKAEYCHHALTPQRKINWNYFREIAVSDENHLQMTGYGGYFDWGLCWWHSRFTRNALHLAVFDPRLPKPSLQEAIEDIRAIRDESHVVVIGGYTCLGEFSNDMYTTIQAVLSNWQLTDSLIFGWAAGLEGSSTEEPNALAARMDRLYEKLQSKPRVYYEMLQLEGPAAHSLLLISMQVLFKDDKTRAGYRLFYVDSNSPEMDTLDYNYGDHSLVMYRGDNVIPYDQFDGDFDHYEKAIKRFCR